MVVEDVVVPVVSSLIGNTPHCHARWFLLKQHALDADPVVLGNHLHRLTIGSSSWMILLITSNLS
jgi:hypothetical protein